MFLFEMMFLMQSQLPIRFRVIHEIVILFFVFEVDLLAQ